MWSSDQWFADLQPEFKLLFIYLFSNERASVCGLYEIPIRVISFETGLDVPTIKSAFEAFGKVGKVLYDYVTGVVFVRNMFKYQGSPSPKLKPRILADIKAVPACALKDMWVNENRVWIGYGSGSDTSSSISISSSISSSVSVEGGGAGEETIPTTPAEAAGHPDIQVYRNISGRFPGENDYATIISTIEFLKQQHDGDVETVLKPYWTAWSTRKTKDGKPYSPASLVWLCEWAMQGEIPKANGHEPKTGETKTDRQAIIRKVAQNAKR
jgi:hypothetical protein